MPPLGKSVAAWKKDYEKLEQSYARQQRMLEELQGELRRVRESTRESTATAVKDSLRGEKTKRAAETEKLKSMAATSTKAASAANGAIVGYYLVAAELDLYIISEEFTRSEWMQAILTTAVTFLLVQVYKTVKS